MKSLKIISKNHVGTLVRITAILSRFGVSLRRLNVVENKKLELFTIQVLIDGEEKIIVQIKKLIEKQINVLTVVKE
jgi:acetolactate synthase small subunit